MSETAAPANGSTNVSRVRKSLSNFTPRPTDRSLAGIMRELEKQRESLGAIGQSLNEILQQIKSMKGELTVLAQRQDDLEELSRSQKQLNDDHYVEHVISPLMRRVSQIADNFGEHLAESSGEGSSSDALELLQGGRNQLLELLSEYGIEIRFAEPGAIFDPAWMQPGKVAGTADKANHETIIRTIRCGFTRGKRLLRPAIVAMFRYEAVSTGLFDPPPSETKGGSK